MTADSPQPGVDTIPALKPALLDTWRAFLGLAAVDIIIKLRGFPSLHQLVKRWPVSGKSIPGRNAEQICQAVEKACTYYFKTSLCLQRSAITTCLLRKHGIHAEMVIGCKVMPYRGHAWVEVEGKVVNDRPSVQQFYQVLDRV
jgi:hypothetical protein